MRRLSYYVVLGGLLLALGLAPGVEARERQQGWPSLDILITALHYDPANNAYWAYLSLSDQASVQWLHISVEDSDTGLTRLEYQVEVHEDPLPPVRLEGGRLEPGHKYVLVVRAVAEKKVYLRRVESGGDRGDSTVLASKAFAHHPTQPALPTVKIDWLEARYPEQTLRIKLDVLNSRPGLTYEVIVVDDNHTRVLETGPAPLTTALLDLPLPEGMLQGGGDRTYRVTLRLADGDGQRLAETVSEDFKASPPAPRGLVTRLRDGLVAYPALPLAMVGTVLLSALALASIRQRSRRPRPVRPSPN